MSIETLDDILEHFAEQMGVYGACPYGHPRCGHCRSCWMTNWKRRMVDAAMVEFALALGRNVMNGDSRAGGAGTVDE